MFSGLTEVNKIYRVDSDVKFEHYYKNRPLTEYKVKDLQSSLRESNLLHINPIIVRKVKVNGVVVYRIIDGQHRNEAAIRENLTRYCIIDESTDEHLMIKLNTQMKNWILQNYAKYWSNVSETSEVYNIYLDYKKYYGKYTTDSIMLMIWNNNRSVHRGRYRRDNQKGGNKTFKDGKLQFDTKIKRRLDKYLPMFEEVYRAAHNPPLQKGAVKRQVFQEVLMNATRKSKCFSYDRFIKNLCTYPHKFNELRLRSDIEQHMYDIERY